MSSVIGNKSVHRVRESIVLYVMSSPFWVLVCHFCFWLKRRHVFGFQSVFSINSKLKFYFRLGVQVMSYRGFVVLIEESKINI